MSNLVLEPCLIEGHEFKPHCTFISLFIELRASPKEVVCDMFSYGPVCLFMYGYGTAHEGRVLESMIYMHWGPKF